MDFGKRLRLLIDSLGVTESKFAENVGLTKTQISQYINGDIKPKIDKLIDFVVKYDNINLHWLLTGQGEMLLTNTQAIPLERRVEELEEQMKEVRNKLDIK